MQKNIRKSAIKFVHKNNLNKKNLTAANLREIIEKYNFSVVDYWTNAKNDSDTVILLEKAQSFANIQKALHTVHRIINGFSFAQICRQMIL